MATLRDNIQNILDASSIQGVYQIYYLSVSHTGRMMRALLATDADLQRLCMVNPEPIVYIEHGGGHQTVDFSRQPNQPEQSAYIPVHDYSGVHSYSQFNPTQEDIDRFGQSNWFSDTLLGGGSGCSLHLDLNSHPPSEDVEEADDTDEEDGHFASIVESDEDEEANLDDDTEDDEEPYVMVDINQPPPVQLETGEAENEEINNWLLPIIPLDTRDSPMLRDLEPILDSQLGLGSVFWSKEDLYIAVGLWHMEHRAEFRVPRSSHSRVEYVCKRNASCPFRLRASWRNGTWYVHKFEEAHTCNLDPASPMAC